MEDFVHNREVTTKGGRTTMPKPFGVLLPALLADIVEDLEHRRRVQIMYLARYGRQSIFDWMDEPVEELDAWTEALNEVIKAENPLTTAGEEY